MIVKVSSPNVFEGLFGSAQATTLGFLSEYWQRRHHAGPCCWVQESSAGFWNWFNLFDCAESVTFTGSTALMNFTDRIPCYHPLKSHMMRSLRVLDPLTFSFLLFETMTAIKYSSGSVPDWGADSETRSWQDRNGRLQVSVSPAVRSCSQMGPLKCFTLEFVKVYCCCESWRGCEFLWSLES